jgi:hypothetical protein
MAKSAIVFRYCWLITILPETTLSRPQCARVRSGTGVNAAAFLDLLDREAPAVEFEGPILEARGAGAPAGELASLDAARRVALRVRAKLEQRRALRDGR